MKDFLKKGLDSFNIKTDDATLDNFIKYNNLLCEWNEKINLTAITEPIDVANKHFIDSAFGANFIKEGANVIDVGAGAGFPSLPLKLIRPDISVTMLDSLLKRVNFLNEVISSLSLSSAIAVHARAEELSRKEKREAFDVCVSRAVANLSVLCELCLPFVCVGGLFLSYKGPDVTEELALAKKAIDVLGGEVCDVVKYTLPDTDITHSVIIIKKVRQTPLKYPRNSGKISKNPIA